MRGVCDMHVHTNPDLRLRAYNDFELAEAGIRVGARAIVIKSHLGFTVNRAAMANEFVRRMYGDDTGFTMYGGVVMNKVIGGVNPEAVEKGLKLGAKVIWLPTQSAKQHLLKMGKDPADGIELVRDGKVIPELKDVFSLIRDYDVTLGTAHVSPEEAFVVVEAARDAGVKKIVVTHPEWWIVGMSVEDQIRMVRDYDVILERCYAQNMGGGTYKSNLPDNLDIIREVGYKNVMVDTDGGQTENPHWELALEEYMQYLSDHGITDDELYYMTRTIPYRLLGIEN
jgi:sugar phosphate isomerase/epimerase